MSLLLMEMVPKLVTYCYSKQLQILKNPAMPLDTCVAMTEGSIGFWLQNALNNELQEQGIDKEVATVVTQVIVDEKIKLSLIQQNLLAHSYLKKMPRNKPKKQVQNLKKMLVVDGVKSFLHQNRLVSKKLLLLDG